MALTPMKISEGELTTASDSKTVSSSWTSIVSKSLTPGVYIITSNVKSNEVLTKFGGRLLNGSNEILASQTVESNMANTGFDLVTIVSISANTSYYVQAYGNGSATATISADIKAYKLE